MRDADLPHRLGGYRLERVLGRGGMGIVHLAWDERLRRRVAIKQVSPERSGPRRRERLRREARTAAQLTHPAIVQIFDLVETDDDDWIVMELVEGQSLAELAREMPLPIDRVLDIGRQIAEGLAAAHALGIVHRDLKTENVAVLADGRVKILDFGLAKRLPTDIESGAAASLDSELSQVGQVLGTGRAMSPEQARGLEVDPRSDLFSLGVLLYEITTGVSPFRGASFYDTLAKVAAHQQSPLDELAPEAPRRLAELVDRLLAKAPELRPTNASAVADTLRDVADERRIASREPSGDTTNDSETYTDSSSTASRSTYSTVLETQTRGRWLTLAIALVLVALGVSWLASRPPSPSRPTTDSNSEPVSPLNAYEEGMRALRYNHDPTNVDHAIDLFQRLLERDPESAAAHAGLARAYWETARNPSAGGDPIFLEQAEAVARDAVRLDGYFADARVSLALVEWLAGRPESARRELDIALELEPTNADAHFALARVAEADGDKESAERHYRRAIALDPAPVYHDALGASLYSAGRYDEAETVFRASLAAAPDNVNALRNLGGVFYATGRGDEAAAMFQRALAIRPDASLYSNLGTIFFDRGLYPKAAAAFEDALAVDGAANHFVYWIHLADAYRQMPDKDEAARASYRSALRLLDERLTAMPANVALSSRRALALARLGDCDAAHADIAEAHRVGVEADVYSRLRLGVALELCDDRETALETLDAALRDGLDVSEVRREPDLLRLRADPRFQRTLTALGPG